MIKHKILIPDRLEEAEIEKKIFGDEYELIMPKAKYVSDISDEIWETCEGILAWHDLEYSKDTIIKLENCKGIVRVGTGYDNIDLDAAKDNNIVVSNIPDYGTNDVADHTLALILSLERNIIKFNQSIKNNGPWSWGLGKNLNRIQDLYFGIIGLGRIGTAVAIRAKAFGMKVAFYDPYIPIGFEKSLDLYRKHSLDELLKESDIISIHTPLTTETKGMVNSRFFKMMKTGSSLINTARGEIVVMDNLYHALKENKIKSVGLDVLEKEPIDYEHPLIKAWQANKKWIRGRLVITPHTAFYNKQSYEEMRRKAAEELLRIIEDGIAFNQIND